MKLFFSFTIVICLGPPGLSACSLKDLNASSTTYDYLKSPNYPNNYPNNADCTWRLDSQDSNHVVAIDVISSDVEYSAGCTKDYVQAFDGNDDSAKSLGKWCGSSVPKKHSSGRYLFLKFVSDSIGSGNGFKISYKAKRKTDHYIDTNVGTIVGGVVGAVVFVAVFMVIVAVIARRRTVHVAPFLWVS